MQNLVLYESMSYGVGRSRVPDSLNGEKNVFQWIKESEK